MNQLNELLYSFAQNGKAPLIESLDKWIEEVQNEGNVSALTAYLFSHVLITKLSELKDLAKEAAITQAERYGKRSNLLDLSIEIKEAGTKYDYTNCGNQTWIKLSEQIQMLQSQQKSVEKTLKTITSPMTVVDDNTGEITTLYPPVKTSSSTITVKL